MFRDDCAKGALQSASLRSAPQLWSDAHVRVRRATLDIVMGVRAEAGRYRQLNVTVEVQHLACALVDVALASCVRCGTVRPRLLAIACVSVCAKLHMCKDQLPYRRTFVGYLNGRTEEELTAAELRVLNACAWRAPDVTAFQLACHSLVGGMCRLPSCTSRELQSIMQHAAFFCDAARQVEALVCAPPQQVGAAALWLAHCVQTQRPVWSDGCVAWWGALPTFRRVLRILWRSYCTRYSSAARRWPLRNNALELLDEDVAFMRAVRARVQWRLLADRCARARRVAPPPSPTPVVATPTSVADSLSLITVRPKDDVVFANGKVRATPWSAFEGAAGGAGGASAWRRRTADATMV